MANPSDSYSKIVLAIVGIVVVFGLVILISGTQKPEQRVGKGGAVFKSADEAGTPTALAPCNTPATSEIVGKFEECNKRFDVVWKCAHVQQCEGVCNQECCRTKSLYELEQECKRPKRYGGICPDKCPNGRVYSRDDITGGCLGPAEPNAYECKNPAIQCICESELSATTDTQQVVSVVSLG